MSKTQNNFKNGEATPIIANTEKKGFVDRAQARLAKLQKKEKALTQSWRSRQQPSQRCRRI